MTPEKLLEKWLPTVNKSAEIGTWTEPVTLCFLAEQASHAKTAIESGTYIGRSAKVMLDANPKLRLFCIDTFDCRSEPMMLEYLDRLDPDKTIPRNLDTYDICRWHSLKIEIEEDRCTLLMADSEAGGEILKFLKEQVDLVFVDDGHDIESVRRDIRCLMPLLRKGGLMCGHDFEVPHNDVARGVIQSGIDFTIPVPRLWAHTKK